jgi:spore germination protein KC
LEMDKKLVFCLLLILGLATSGCWDYQEINDLAIVLAAGVDSHREGGVQLLVEIAKPEQMAGNGGGGQGSSGKPIEILESVGSTIHQAQRNLHWRSSRDVYWAHKQVLIIGEDLARQGIAPLLDWFERDHQARHSIPLLVTNGPVRNVFQAQPELESTLAEEIIMLIEHMEKQSQGYGTMLKDFLHCLSSQVQHPVTGRLEVIQKEEPHGGSLAGAGIGGGQGAGGGMEPVPPRALRLAGLAVFKGDRLVGWLDERETRGFRWIIGEVKGALVDVTVPGEPQNKVTLEIARADSVIIPQVKGEQLTFTVRVKTQAAIGQYEGTLALSPGLFSTLEAACSAVIRKEMEDSLERVQREYRVDIFGFGKELRRRYPNVWRKWEGKWDSQFPLLPIEVVVESKITNSGLVTSRVPVAQK